MVKAYNAVLKMSLRHKTDMRTAAYVVAIDRVATVTRLRGMYAQPVVKRRRRTETGEAPRGQGATSDNTALYSREATPPPGMHRPSNAAGVSPGLLGAWHLVPGALLGAGPHQGMFGLWRDEDRRPRPQAQFSVALLRQVHAHDRAPLALELHAHERSRRVDGDNRRAELARVGPAQADFEQVRPHEHARRPAPPGAGRSARRALAPPGRCGRPRCGSGRYSRRPGTARRTVSPGCGTRPRACRPAPTRPWCMITTRSDSSSASSWSCVTNSVVTCSRSCSARQPAAQVLPHSRIQRAERLVEQQDLRLDGQRARERHALPLAAGQLRRIPLRQRLELDQPQQLLHALLDALSSRGGRFAGCTRSPKATFSKTLR